MDTDPDGATNLQIGYLRTSIEEGRQNLELVRKHSRRLKWIAWALLAGFIAFVVAISIIDENENEALSDAVGILGALCGLGAFVAWLWRRRDDRTVDQLGSDLDLQDLELQALEASGTEDRSVLRRPSELKRLVLPAKIRQLKKALSRATFWLYLAWMTVVLFVTLGTLIASGAFGGFGLKLGAGEAALGTGFYAVLAIVWAFGRHVNIRSLRQEIRESEIELDLSQYAATAAEERAEKLFQKNQLDLREYYQLNLAQTRMAFVIGLFCILAGLGVVGFTFALLTGPNSGGPPSSDDTKFLIAAVGAISSIMINVVAAIFLKLHGSASRDLNEFHARLRSTNELFLANVIASRLSDAELKQQTLADMARAIAVSPAGAPRD